MQFCNRKRAKGRNTRKKGREPRVRWRFSLVIGVEWAGGGGGGGGLVSYG